MKNSHFSLLSKYVIHYLKTSYEVFIPMLYCKIARAKGKKHMIVHVRIRWFEGLGGQSA